MKSTAAKSLSASARAYSGDLGPAAVQDPSRKALLSYQPRGQGPTFTPEALAPIVFGWLASIMRAALMLVLLRKAGLLGLATALFFMSTIFASRVVSAAAR